MNRIELKGLWWMNGNKAMRQYLGINPKDELPVYEFCIEVSEDEKSAKIYFVNYPIVYDVKIENIGLNKYNMIYKGKKREFVLGIDENENVRYWYFKDTSPKGPEDPYRYDGSHYLDFEDSRFEKTADGLLKYIEYISSIDDGGRQVP